MTPALQPLHCRSILPDLSARKRSALLLLQEEDFILRTSFMLFCHSFFAFCSFLYLWQFLFHE
jgi:hypothetical protein